MKSIKTFLLVAASFVLADVTLAQTWTQIGLSNMQWHCFATSANGNTLVAEPFYPSGQIFVSTNGGATWNTNASPTLFQPGYGPYPIPFMQIASSADGTKLAGAYVGGAICTSTNSGTTWATNNVPAAAWYSIASSADGTRLIVVAGGGQSTIGPIYISTNSGISWLSTSAPSNHWRSVASSADGTKIIAGSEGTTTIFTSTNSGTTWMSGDSMPTNRQWTVACSADGSKMVAAYYSNPNYALTTPGNLFTSTDSGCTWESNRFVSSFFGAVAISADGNKIVAVAQDPVVFVSTNFGTSWATNNLPSGSSFSSVALSADGGKVITGSLFLSGYSGYGFSYTSQSVYAPQLNLASSPTNLTLGWTIPSTNFVLQLSSNLVSWADVTNPPALNLTNLQNEVTLSPSNGSSFYRLKTP